MAKVDSAVITDTNCAPSLNRLAREQIDTDYIEYLEIDNRIIIDRTDSNG